MASPLEYPVRKKHIASTQLPADASSTPSTPSSDDNLVLSSPNFAQAWQFSL